VVNRLAALFADRPPVLDGGYGWLFQERGLEPGVPAELWNATEPARVEDVHEAYAASGAQWLTTNTFGGTRPRLGMHDLETRVAELDSAGAAIARRVADRHGILVAGDVGPSGELLAPLGTMELGELQELFAEQIRALVAGGIDLVLIETMSDLAEIGAAVAAAHEAAPTLPIVTTLSFDTNLRTMMGVTPEAAVRQLSELGVDAVGANCGRGPQEMEQIADQLVASRTDGLLLVAQSNAGLPALDGDQFVYTVGPAELAAHAVRLRNKGIDLIGACCGSSPEHIAAIAAGLG
jgi:methionine synthase I (cobalamin-dependent)